VSFSTMQSKCRLCDGTGWILCGNCRGVGHDAGDPGSCLLCEGASALPCTCSMRYQRTDASRRRAIESDLPLHLRSRGRK
jgi:hypothetical protein